MGGGRLLTAVALCLWTALPGHADVLHDGIEALRQGQYEQAERLLRAAAKAKPQDPVPVEWLTTLFEQTMDPTALNAALTELHRRRAALKPRLPKVTEPVPQPRRQTAATRIRLDGSTMPKREDALVDLGPLPTLPPDPLTPANAPSLQTPAGKRWRLQRLGDSLAAMLATLRQLRDRFGGYGQAPPKVQQMTQELEQKVVNHRKAMTQLQRELGD